jgi:hypothetical protein
VVYLFMAGSTSKGVFEVGVIICCYLEKNGLLFCNECHFL